MRVRREREKCNTGSDPSAWRKRADVCVRSVNREKEGPKKDQKSFSLL